jgi:hypothetical protein
MGQTGIGTVGGYQLQAGSPCINSGMVIPDNGGMDYAGNPIDKAPDRGAFEWQGSGAISIRPVSAGRSAMDTRRGSIPTPGAGSKKGSSVRFTEAEKIFNALGKR